MLRYEYQQKLLVRHSHGNVQKDSSYFKEMPEVPNDIIVVNEQPKVVMKQLEQQQQQQNSTNSNNLHQFQQHQQLNQVNSPNMIQQTSSNSIQMHSNNNQMQSILNNPNNNNMINNRLDLNNQINMNQQSNLMNNQINMNQQSGLNMMNNKPIVGQMQTPNVAGGYHQNILNNNNSNQLQINNNNSNLMLQNSLLNSKNVINNPGVVGVSRLTPEKQRGGNTGSGRKPKQARGGARATRTPSNQQPIMGGLTTPPIMLQNANNPLVNQNPNWPQQQQQLQNNNLQQHGLYGQTNGPTNNQTSILHSNQASSIAQQPVNQLQHNTAMRQSSWGSQMAAQQTQPLVNNTITNAYPTQAQTPIPQQQQQQYMTSIIFFLDRGF